MGEVINLNKWKKQKASVEKQKRAEQNRLKQGVSSAERALVEKRRALEQKKLDGHKLESDD